MQKTILCALALALSTTLAIAAEPDAMGKDAPMGDAGSMQAMTPKPAGDSMMSDDKMMSGDKMGAGDSMKSDDKMKTDDKMAPKDSMGK